MSSNEKPSIILKPKHVNFFLALILLLSCFVFSIFGIIIPFIATWELNSIWPPSEKRLGIKAVMLFLSFGFLALMPSCIPMLNRGTVYIYKNKIEVFPLLRLKSLIFEFNSSRLRLHGDYRLSIRCKKPSFHNSIFTRLGARFINAVSLGLHPRGWKNPEEIEKALSFLREKSSDFGRTQSPF